MWKGKCEHFDALVHLFYVLVVLRRGKLFSSVKYTLLEGGWKGNE